MKKLNALVAAISLGLTVSFAALPLASAHSTLNVGHSHTKSVHQKHDDPNKYAQYEKKYERLKRQHVNHANQPDFSKLFEACERITPVDVTSITGVITATTSATAQTVASFTVPRYCDNSIALAVDATSPLGTTTPSLTCQIYDETGTAIGSPSTQTFVTAVGAAIEFPLIAAEIAKNFPAFYPGGYGSYGSGAYYPATGTSLPGASPLLQTETKTVRCFANTATTGITVTSVDGQVDSQRPSQFVVYNLPSAPYANYAEGGYGYYAKHIKHIVKH